MATSSGSGGDKRPAWVTTLGAAVVGVGLGFAYLWWREKKEKDEGKPRPPERVLQPMVDAEKALAAGDLKEAENQLLVALNRLRVHDHEHEAIVRSPAPDAHTHSLAFSPPSTWWKSSNSISFSSPLLQVLLHDRLANLYHHQKRWADAIEQYTAVAQGMTHLGRPVTDPALIEVRLHTLTHPLPPTTQP
jgi:hypothetical protein